MYCTVADVESYYNNVSFNDDGYVSGNECEAFIIQESAFMDMYLRKRYSLPVTDATDLLVLKMICAKLVVGTIDEIIREKNPTDEEERGRNYRRDALKILDKIISGEMTLAQAAVSSVMKFNNIDSNGNTVQKNFKIAEIEPSTEYYDRETRRIIS